jgi:hypothetical protein
MKPLLILFSFAVTVSNAYASGKALRAERLAHERQEAIQAEKEKCAEVQKHVLESLASGFELAQNYNHARITTMDQYKQHAYGPGPGVHAQAAYRATTIQFVSSADRSLRQERQKIADEVQSNSVCFSALSPAEVSVLSQKIRNTQ